MASPLDQAVRHSREELEFTGVTWPEALYLLGTGVGVLPERLHGRGTLPLGSMRGVPGQWRSGSLYHGQLDPQHASLGTWILEDAGSREPPPAERPWSAAFPCWLAALMRAGVLVHVAAGSALPQAEGEPPPVGSLVLLSDHLNLSGHTPLSGLGESQLGPLFPDLSQLHNAELRAAALEVAQARGLAVREAIAACTLGPALDTPAERRFQALAGAQVSVQGLAWPLLAAAHAGLAVLSIVVVTDDGEGPTDVRAILRASEAAAPALDELLFALVPEVARVARRLAREIDCP